MKYPIKLSGFVLALGLLTACGGGGGGDTPVASGTKVTPEKNNTVASIHFVAEEHKGFIKQAKLLNIYDESNDKVFKTILLYDLPKGIYNETFTIGKVRNHLKGINQIYSTTYAMYNDESYIAKKAEFTGLPTKMADLPTQGKAIYIGKSLGLNTSGHFKLEADFGNKDVQGQITDRITNRGKRLADIELRKSYFKTSYFQNNKEAITFKGLTRSNAEYGHYHGMFAGPNGEEVTGFLSEYNSYNPYESFAGEKQ